MGEKVATENGQRAAIKGYLQQYHTAQRAKRILEDRHQILLSELNSPGVSSAFRPMPPARAGPKDRAASAVFLLTEIEKRIEAQQCEAAKAVLRVMDLIDLLPQNSAERMVVELRHIDCKGWDQIAREVYMSRAAVFKRYNAALDMLLGHEKTQELVEKYNDQ